MSLTESLFKIASPCKALLVAPDNIGAHFEHSCVQARWVHGAVDMMARVEGVEKSSIIATTSSQVTEELLKLCPSSTTLLAVLPYVYLERPPKAELELLREITGKASARYFETTGSFPTKTNWMLREGFTLKVAIVEQPHFVALYPVDPLRSSRSNSIQIGERRDWRNLALLSQG